MRSNGKNKLLIYLLEQTNGSQLLISEKQILSGNSYLSGKQELLNYLKLLSSENYFEIIYTDRHGEPFFCIQPLQKGKSYFSEKKALKRDLIYKFSVAIISGAITFLLGKLLYIIFS